MPIIVKVGWSQWVRDVNCHLLWHIGVTLKSFLVLDAGKDLSSQGSTCPLSMKVSQVCKYFCWCHDMCKCMKSCLWAAQQHVRLPTTQHTAALSSVHPTRFSSMHCPAGTQAQEAPAQSEDSLPWICLPKYPMQWVVPACSLILKMFIFHGFIWSFQIT